MYLVTFTLGHLYSVTFFSSSAFFSQNLGFTTFVVFLLKEHFYSGTGFFLVSRLSGFSIVQKILI